MGTNYSQAIIRSFNSLENAIRVLIDEASASIANSDDAVKTFTWLDFGTANQRVSIIVITSASLSATVTKTFAYTLTGGAYRLDSITPVIT